MAKQTFTVGQVLTAAQLTSLQQTAMGGGAASAKTASYTLVAADAGTAISMTSTSATTITVNTGLFAAGDTVQITNLGSGVSTITAGTATVNTSASLALAQYESGTLNFTSTSAAIFIKGAGAAAASGGMTLLSTTTLSGLTTTISSINQTYNTLMVVVTGMTGNTSDSLFRLMPNGSSTESTYAVNNQGAVSQVRTRIALASVVTTRTSAANAWTIIFNNYTSATTAKPFNFYGYFTDASGTQSTHGGGAYVSASALSSLVFDYQGANTFAGGTVLIYGVK